MSAIVVGDTVSFKFQGVDRQGTVLMAGKPSMNCPSLVYAEVQLDRVSGDNGQSLRCRRLIVNHHHLTKAQEVSA